MLYHNKEVKDLGDWELIEAYDTLNHQKENYEERIKKPKGKKFKLQISESFMQLYNEIKQELSNRNIDMEG